MKKSATLLIGLFSTITAFCQVEEFKVYPNGLIYSEKTMGKLSHIVDSLNLKFKSCNFNTVFYSKSQTIGYIVHVNKSNIKEAKRDMESQISIENFIKKYPKSTVKSNVLIIKSKYKDYKNEDVIEFEEIDLKGDNGFSITLDKDSHYFNDFSNQWLLRYREKTQYADESLSAFYFPTNFQSVSIPQKYSQMIGYSDCIIDTTTTKFKKILKSGWIDLPENWTSLSAKKKVQLLDEMRSIRVIGDCSQDSRPRAHAINIALLSAETYKWEVFLKAHLDIMNDHFERMSDGNYAWERRNTYIKELEELNINVADLMFGISFRIENPSSNHYFGSIGRLGRAFSETKNRSEIEQSMLAIVSDKELDIYNRLLFYFLFLNYNENIRDEAIKKKNNDKLVAATKTLPNFISEKLLEK